jgi:hypothetical protein
MKKLLLIFILAGAVYAQNIVDSYNSSASGQIMDSDTMWTGTARDLGNYSGVTVSVRASHASAEDGFVIHFSNNKTTWIDSIYTSVLANDWTVLRFTPKHYYYRVRYRNGSDSLTSFTLVSMLTKNVYDRTYINNYAKMFTADTLGYGDSLGVGYFRNDFILRGVTIRDTGLTTAAGLRDSVLFEAYDTVFSAWKAVAVKNLQTGAIISAGTVLVTESGTITDYEFFRKFGDKVRVRKINSVLGLNGLSGKTPIYFWGNN